MRNHNRRPDIDHRRKPSLLRAALMGVLAWHFMPRYCPNCYGLHSPMFWPYPGSYCHKDW